MAGRSKSRLPVALLVLVALAATLAGCGSSGRPDDAPTAVRVALLSADPPSLSMLDRGDINSQRLATQLTDSLVQYDDDLRLVGRLATDWRVSDDGRTITFDLRRGVTWHDGEPFTSSDVLFTVERVRDPEVGNTIFAPRLETLVSLEAPDPHTVVATYEAPFLDMLEPWRMPMLPRHAAEGQDLMTGEFSKHPIGCGPFRFVRHVPGQEIVLAAFDDYWDGRPAIDRLVLKIFAEQQTAYLALLAGEIDLMTMPPDQFAEARASDAAHRWAFDVYHTFSAWLLAWNQADDSPYFTDARVRRALVHALDRDTFIETVLAGQARAGVTTFHPDLPFAHPDARPIPYDLAEARRLLADAGWADTDGDGWLDRGGRPFRFTMLVAQSSQKLVDDMAAWQQASWREIGVDARIDRLEWQAFRARRNAGEFDLASYSLRFSPSPDQYDLYHSAARANGINYFGLADDEVDRLVERVRDVSLTDEARRATLLRLQERLQELEPVTCLFYFATPLVYDRRLEGVDPSPLGLVQTTSGPRQWRWSEDPKG